MIGKTIAHYEVTEKIGAGGMGEVYRARDTKLGRDVALKFLPQHFAADQERLSRFDREAKLLAGLNHAHIAAIYGIEAHEGSQLLVLELVEGEDLSERLARGPMPVDDALTAAHQICEALEVAHDQGVVHRDLKPANVKITPDGVVKVLDFGLAKALDTADGNSEITSSPTMLMSSPTVQGVILGTAAYMSPEQARGKTVDRRADIFSFGCVFFEMLSGKMAFTGETVSDTLASILKETPDLDALPDNTPPRIKRLIERCLDKNPRQRLRDIGEARILIDKVIRGDVEDAEAATTSAAPVPQKSNTVERIAFSAIAIVLAAAALFVGRSIQPTAPEQPLRRFSIPVITEGVDPTSPVISPNGTHLAYLRGKELFVHAFDALEPTLIETPNTAREPFWSPDGSHLGYMSDGKIWKVPVNGGASTMICDPGPAFGGGSGGCWTEDGRIIFANGSTGLLQVSVQGGDESPFLELSETDQDHHEPSMLPGDAGALFIPHNKGRSADQIVLVVNGERKVLLEVPNIRLAHPRYSHTGHITYRRPGANGGVWALPFSLETLEVTGEPFIVAADARDASTSRNGMMVYLKGGSDGSLVTRWLTRDGDLGEPLSEPSLGQGWYSFAPDKDRVVYSEIGSEDIDLWIHDLARGARTRFTFESGPDIFGIWEPNGKYIYYWRVGPDSIYRRLADGTGAPEPVLSGGQPHVSPDNRHIVYRFRNDATDSDVYYAAIEDLEPKPLIVVSERQEEPSFSPDGAYIGYESDQSGTDEIFITRFPSGEGKWQVSIGGATTHRWSPDGDAIYYAKDNGDVYEVKVNMDASLQLSRPTLLFDSTEINLPAVNYPFYARSPDDPNRFLIMNPLRTDRSEINTGITVVENWLSEFSGEK